MMPRLICLPLVLAFATAQPAAAQEVGRLFSTPEARTKLDRMRLAGPRAIDRAAEEAADEVPVEPPVEVAPVVVPVEGDRVVVVDGVVTRSGSSVRTTWIDAVAQRDNDRKNHSIPVLPGDAGWASVVVQLPSGKLVRLKAGQRVDAVSGRVREVYDPDLPRR